MPFGSLTPVFEAMTGFGTLGLALVTLQGLQSWKQQRIWDHSLEIGRQLLREIVVFEKEFVAITRGYPLTDEVANWLEQNGRDPFKTSPEALRAAFKVTLEGLENRHSVLVASLNEAATIWGDSILDWTSDIKDLMTEFDSYGVYYLLATDPGIGDSEKWVRERLQHYRPIFSVNFDVYYDGYGVFFTSDDGYLKDLSAAIAALKSKVREKMQLPN